ncbi:MAG: Nif3-like dinuclear metal center hexameric protein [Pirellulales bacterium]
MTTVAEAAALLESWFPRALAAEWDNVGLLLGDAAGPAERIMTCLSLTRDVVDEAVAERAQLVVTHHPLPFRALKSITTVGFDGSRLWRLATAGVAVYSPHTAFDSAARGINQRFSELLNLKNVRPLAPIAGATDPQIGIGRMGELAAPTKLDDLARLAKRGLNAGEATFVGDASRAVRHVGIACGSAGDLMKQAVKLGCDAFITGEANFHTALEAEAAEIGLVLVGHFASEHFAMVQLADDLQKALPAATVWPARREADPLRGV